MTTPVLQTPRLILRPVALTDAPAVQKHFNNWNIIRHLSLVVPWPYPDDGAETFIKSKLPEIAEVVSHVWALVLKDHNNEAIGIVDFRLKENPEQGARGFWLAEVFWGHGLMTEAVTAVNDFIFGTLKVEKYTVTNAASNTASRRVKEKTGARFIGIQQIPHHGGETDSEVWEVTRESWLKTR